MKQKEEDLKNPKKDKSDDLDFWGFALRVRFIGGVLILVTLLIKAIIYIVNYFVK